MSNDKFDEDADWLFDRKWNATVEQVEAFQERV